MTVDWETEINSVAQDYVCSIVMPHCRVYTLQSRITLAKFVELGGEPFK